MSFVIAVDYDGTLFTGSFGVRGDPIRPVIDKVKEFQKTGMCETILWTCREAGTLQEAIERCKEEGLIFDAINTNSPFENKFRVHMLKSIGHIFANKKIYADLYVDDKSPGSIEYFLNLNVEEECSKIRKRDKELGLDTPTNQELKEPQNTQNTQNTQKEPDLFIAIEDLTGFNPDGPDFLNNDNGIIEIKKGTVLMESSYYDENAIEFEIYNTGEKVMLHRERVCEEVSKPEYYDNYFTYPKGLKAMKKG